MVQDTLAAENHPGLELVIPKSPVEIVDANEFLQVPVMTGSVRDEGSLVVGRECPLKICVVFFGLRLSFLLFSVLLLFLCHARR